MANPEDSKTHTPPLTPKTNASQADADTDTQAPIAHVSTAGNRHVRTLSASSMDLIDPEAHLTPRVATSTSQASAQYAASSGPAPASLTPSTPTIVSDRAISPHHLDMFNTRLQKHGVSPDAKAAHYKRARIYSKTRPTIRQQTRSMFVIAARGQRSGYLPTRKTRPALNQRRYSIDVNTMDWSPDDPRSHEGWNRDGRAAAPSSTIQYYELDPPAQREYSLPLPNPSRYGDLNLRMACNPPLDTNIYLELGAATIHNDAVLYMTHCTWDSSGEAWMRDESLDMALEVLRLDQNCATHGIDFVNCNTAQVFWLATITEDAHEKCYDEYRMRFHDKRWIFISMNNGIGSGSHGGIHWSLIAVDRTHKQVHYYDSLFIHYSDQIELARQISLGLLQILREDVDHWRFIKEENSPHQTMHNLFRGDVGPCAPFVYKMTQVLVNHIIRYRITGNEAECLLSLEDWFPTWFAKQFHSLEVRRRMQSSLVPWKRRALAMDTMRLHDQFAIYGEDVVMDMSPLDAMKISSVLRKRARTPDEVSETEEEESNAGSETGEESKEIDPNATVLVYNDVDRHSEHSESATEILHDDLDETSGNPLLQEDQERRHSYYDAHNRHGNDDEEDGDSIAGNVGTEEDDSTNEDFTPLHPPSPEASDDE